MFRHFGPAFRDQHGASLSPTRWRAMNAIESCHTAALGGHVERCDDCGHQRVAHNSCLMGKFSNGESKVTIPRFMLPRPFFALHYCGILEQGDQLVRRPEGAFAQVRRHDRLDRFELFSGIAARVDFGACQGGMSLPKGHLADVLESCLQARSSRRCAAGHAARPACSVEAGTTVGSRFDMLFQ